MDQLEGKLFKYATQEFSVLLAQVFNKMFETGKILQELKKRSWKKIQDQLRW